MIRVSRPVRIYLTIILGMLLLRAIPLVISISWPNPDRIPPWGVLLVFGAAGLLGVYLASRAGFPEIGSQHITPVQRFVIPSVMGVGFGIVTVLLDMLQPLDPALQIQFPTSLIAYPLGGIIEEILFRLVLTTLLVWLISTIILKGKFQQPVFWVIAFGIALLYAGLQIAAYAQIAGPVGGLTALRFILLIGVYFLVAAFVYRRYGFVAVVMMRLGQYAIWHILWGFFVTVIH
jgi:hypothetical protein